jgi:hypothetical protein
MKPSWTFTRGLLLGATLMFFLDPSTGGRRRALVRIPRGRAGTGLPALPRPLRLLAAAAGAVAVAYGTRRAMDRTRTGESESSLAPNYAYLR